MAVDPLLTLVRHGETEWSASGRHTSSTDVALTAKGRSQASRLAAVLSGSDYVQVLSSPKRRALSTADLAGFGARAVVSETLLEWDYGEYEGLTTPQIQARDPGWSVFSAPTPGGEPAFHVEQRADRVVALARAGKGPVLCFGHGHFSRVVAARWLGLGAADGARFHLDTGGVGVLGLDRGTPVLARWNAG